MIEAGFRKKRERNIRFDVNGPNPGRYEVGQYKVGASAMGARSDITAF